MNVLKQSRWSLFLRYVFLILVTLFFLLPFIWILRCSLITKAEAYMIPPNWSAKLTLENYVAVFQQNTFGKYFLNSLIIALASTILSILLGAMASYWIARISKRPNPIKICILCTQMIPPVVLVIPLALIINNLRMGDTYIALIVAYLTFNLPYVIWQLISFFQSIPKELDEASEVDGCTRLQAYFRIILPLAMPGIMASGVYCFIISWNEFMFATILVDSSALRTIPVGLMVFRDGLMTEWGVVMAGMVISCIPLIVIYLFMSKSFIRGLTAGSVKG